VGGALYSAFSLKLKKNVTATGNQATTGLYQRIMQNMDFQSEAKQNHINQALCSKYFLAGLRIPAYLKLFHLGCIRKETIRQVWNDR